MSFGSRFRFLGELTLDMFALLGWVVVVGQVDRLEYVEWGRWMSQQKSQEL